MNSFSIRKVLMLSLSTITMASCNNGPVSQLPTQPTVTRLPTPIPTATIEPGILTIPYQDFGLSPDAEVWALPNEHIVQVAYSPDGHYLAALATSGVLIYTTNPLDKSALIEDNTNYLIDTMTWSPDSKK